MSGVGLRASRLCAPPVVPLPNQLGIGGKSLRSRQLSGIEIAPISVLAAESLQAAVGGEPGSSDDQQATLEPAIEIVRRKFSRIQGCRRAHISYRFVEWFLPPARNRSGSHPYG